MTTASRLYATFEQHLDIQRAWLKQGKMKRLITRFWRGILTDGVGPTLRSTGHHLLRRWRGGHIDISLMVLPEDVLAADYLRAPYRQPSPISRKSALDIAWIVSPLTPSSGGQADIARFAHSLQVRGHRVALYLYEGISEQATEEGRRILSDRYGVDLDVRKIADLSAADAVIATGWETAYPVFNLDTSAHKFYFVQDFEPSFYPVGSKSVLAENTYRFGFHGLTLGAWLAHRLRADYGMTCDHFDFGADLSTYRPVGPSNKQKKVCFYARPVTDRRAFELGVLALRQFHERHPDYEIDLFGWETSSYRLGFPHTSRGILKPTELAKMYQEATACLVLSLTNVSLLPLELLASGCIPVMNDGDNTRMALGVNDFIEYAPCMPQELAHRLSGIVSGDIKTLNDRARAASLSVEDRSWDSSYAAVEHAIKRQVFGS